MNDSFEFKDLDPKIKKYILNKQKRFRETYPGEEDFLNDIKYWLAEKLSGAPGHGAAVTFPDGTYLQRSFRDEDTGRESGERDNPATFLEGCESLYNLFRNFAKARPDLSEKTFSEFSDIRKRRARAFSDDRNPQRSGFRHGRARRRTENFLRQVPRPYPGIIRICGTMRGKI